MAQRLPIRPRPAPDELFSSWLMRVAAAYGLEVRRFLQDTAARSLEPELGRWFEDRTTMLGSMADYCEPAPVVELMASATGYPLDELQRLTSDGPHRGVPNQLLISPGKDRDRSSAEKPGGESSRPVESYCPECLHEKFYVRRHWRLAFYCSCPIHRRELLDACPQCGIDLDFLGRLMADHPPITGTGFLCQQCAFDLIQAPPDPAGFRTTPKYLDFQRFIVAFGALQTPNASRRMTSRVFGDLHALIDAIAASDVSRLLGELELPSSSFPRDILTDLNKSIAYNLRSGVARHFLFRVTHLCLDRRLAHRTSRLEIKPDSQIDAFAASLSPLLLELILFDYPEFLVREDNAATHP